jgi:hypothetical protein
MRSSWPRSASRFRTGRTSICDHVDNVAGLDGHLAVLVEKLGDGDDAFGLVPDVDDHLRGGHLEHRPLDDLAFRDVAEAVIVDLQQLVELGGIHLVAVFTRTGLQPTAIVAFSAFQRSRTAPSRAGSVLVVYVRHALRVLQCRLIAGMCEGGPGPLLPACPEFR